MPENQPWMQQVYVMHGTVPQAVPQVWYSGHLLSQVMQPVFHGLTSPCSQQTSPEQIISSIFGKNIFPYINIPT